MGAALLLSSRTCPAAIAVGSKEGTLPSENLDIRKPKCTLRVGWMLSTHSPPQKCRNIVCFMTLSTSGAATLREARMMASAFSTSSLMLHALNTASD